MTKISRVLVIGSKGLVGHGIVTYLLRKNYYIIGTSSTKKKKELNLKNFKLYDSIDLLKQESYSRINKILVKHKIQAIINSAALVPNKPKYDDRNFFNKSLIINYFSYQKIYEISKKNKIKFLINISTPNVTNVKFDNLCEHHNFYIFTKFLTEKYLLNIKNKKINISSLRIKSPYGYILNTKAVIPSFIKKIKSNKKIIIDKKKIDPFAFTFVEDIGATCEKIIINKLNGIKHCYGDEKISIQNLNYLINDLFSKKKIIKIKNKKDYQIKKNKIKKNINPIKTSIFKGLQMISNYINNT